MLNVNFTFPNVVSLMFEKKYVLHDHKSVEVSLFVHPSILFHLSISELQEGLEHTLDMLAVRYRANAERPTTIHIHTWRGLTQAQGENANFP